MFQFLEHLRTAAYNLTKEERARSVKTAALVFGGLGLLVLFAAMVIAGRVVPAEHPVWEAILLARLSLVRLVLAIPVLLAGMAAAVLLYQALENTALGVRMLMWASTDDRRVKAQKTRNAGNLLATLMAACIIALVLGVLR